MRFVGRRKKKLRVAFHFQFSNPAGWRCDECRASGLEIKRRCGHLERALSTVPKVVWTRGGVGTTVCPRSYISGKSTAWLEQYEAWKRFGSTDLRSLTARLVHAIVILEQESRQEAMRGDK